MPAGKLPLTIPQEESDALPGSLGEKGGTPKGPEDPAGQLDPIFRT